LKRNCDKRSGEYRYDLAQRKYHKRKKEKPKRIRFTPWVQRAVEELLRQDYSPEQVVGTLKKRGGTLHTHLRSRGRRYRKRGNAKDNRDIIKNGVGIEHRPEIV